MKKTSLILLALLLICSSASFAAVGKDTEGPFGYNLYEDINRNSDSQPKSNSQPKNDSKTNASSKEFYADDIKPEWETERTYYPNANIKSAVGKYKAGNYSGCLQEMISLTRKDPSNPLVYYYLGMSYAQVGKKDQAVKAYEVVLKLNSDKTIAEYARKGRDCLVGGPTCTPETEGQTDEKLDEFINSPYGNGFSKELNQEVKEQKLKNIQKTINEKQDLEDSDIKNIQKFDRGSENFNDTKLAQNDNVSNDDIIKAIETLKKAGVTVSVSPVNSQYNDMSMLLGTNNNRNDAMMNMIPFLMNQHQNGQNIDPQILQSLMMNSMLPDFTFNNNDNKY